MSARILDIDGRTDIPRVLFVDDDAGNRQAFHASFRKEFDVMTASGMEEAWLFLSNRGVDVLITDQRMPGTTGSELLRLVRDHFPQVRRMLLTGYSDLQALVDAINQGGVINYITKPWDPDQVRHLVNAAFSEVRAERDRTAYTQQLLESNRQLEFALRQRLLS